ncbi:MAG: gamma-glutamyl-gamma-aminobutyrate hydrolase family protein [Prevotella sp.]|nr:gamma-glutamyl-gamma-aminobutyrate hydrolase family protein [Prevotella sp.]
MKQFDIEAHIAEVYANFPAAGRCPVIGITGNYEDLTCKLGKGYYESVVKAGGVPIIIPPCADKHVLMGTLDHLDALILSGGGDINPLYSGEEPVPGLHGINQERDLPELLITRLAYNRQLPMLGICRGIQTLAVALGGKVCQDIGSDQRKMNSENLGVKHSQDADRSEPTHSITVTEDSTLYNIYRENGGKFFTLHSSLFTLYVNSFHHQAVSEPGTKFRVTAVAKDGIIEAIESTEFKSIIGVQWHPECMGDDGQPLFRWLVGEARAYRQAQEVHNRVLTLDTHCDTPMFFPQDIHFEQRDPRILVDLHKMTEGRQDATIMVAYLPQPKMGETFSSKVDIDVQSPTEYADLVFDKIEDIVAQNSRYISIARTPADLYEDKRHGRKSIMLGIENGLALSGQLQNVKHFADRGVVYITLCHNGDNDLCDSARGCNTHGGVSRFGEQVIREMNRLGLMVDLSHAGEKSFYDALDISQTPIVCSHSSCRALCDHPRNLTDEQMRRLAAAGGVMQVTLYNGFQVKTGEASIRDAIAHLEHAIHVMGIDHVGLGTDFDGDGGICGLRDSSELIQFTRQLLSRNYSERDIQKIWGGNFLRVMSQVQKMRN